jgi:hypothetical protein
VAQYTRKSSVAIRPFIFQARLQPLAPVGILHLTTLPSTILQFPSSSCLPDSDTVHLEHRILDILKALDAALHLLRCRVVSSLGVLVNVKLIMLVVAALVLSLHDVLPQNLGDGLHVLDRIIDLF